MRKYLPPVHALMVRRGLSEADAEELAQDAMIKIYKWLTKDGFKPGEIPFRVMLYKCSNEVHADKIKKLQRRPNSLPLGPNAEVNDRAYFDAAYYENVVKTAMREVERRAEVGSWAVYQALLNNVSPDEVATAYGKTVDTIYAIKSRLNAMLLEECLKLDEDHV